MIWARRTVTLSPMFIRRTRTRSGNEDSVTFRLVRSERVEAKVQQRTLLNLGRHFEVSPADWPRLCQRLEDILAGQLPLSPDTPAALEEHAQRIAAQLLARARVGRAAAHAAPDVQSVDVNSLALLRPRTVGVEQVALWSLVSIPVENSPEVPVENSPLSYKRIDPLLAPSG